MKKELSLEFLKENMMGPNCIRILEELSRDFNLRPGSRIMDLGCGKGLTSIFLATEFDVQVYATDLWITATENYERFRELGLEDRIVPIHADAFNLPYAEGFFDGIVSVDSYHYFGTGEDFLGRYLVPLVKNRGFIAAAMPGLQKELWSKENSVEITHSRSMDCHRKAWEDWLQCDNPYAKSDIGFIAADDGRYIDTVEIVAKVK